MEENESQEQEESNWVNPKDAIPAKDVVKPPAEQKDRVTAVLSVTHQHCCIDPVDIRPKFEYDPEFVEEPYKRRKSVNREWVPLDLGWLSDRAGLVVLENWGTKKPQTMPTREQREAEKDKILEIGIMNGNVYKRVMIVRPGLFQVVELDPEVKYFVRCRQESTIEYHIVVMPR